MPRLTLLTLFALLVVVPVIAFQHTRRGRARSNRAPSIQSFTASKAVIDLCPIAPNGTCSASGTIVSLEVNASDPNNDSLTYKYSVSTGVIVGSGPAVNWDLGDGRLGTQTARVEVVDASGAKASKTAQVDLVECGACDFPCPVISVSCPTNVAEGDIATFNVFISGDDPERKLIYLWSHANGQRFPGQEGATLRIKAVGSPGEIIVATVRVLGIDPSCSRAASCETRIEKKSAGQ